MKEMKIKFQRKRFFCGIQTIIRAGSFAAPKCVLNRSKLQKTPDSAVTRATLCGLEVQALKQFTRNFQWNFLSASCCFISIEMLLLLHVDCLLTMKEMARELELCKSKAKKKALMTE